MKINVSNGLDATERKNDWNNIFAEVIDETLKQVFKEDGTKVIYDYLKNNSKLSLKDISKKPEEFSASLETLMVSAARVIERLILTNLYSRLEQNFKEKEGYKFSDYIKELRRR